MTKNPTKHVLKVGLTGGIGVGKTAVSDLFAEHGITIIDADIVAREIVKPDTPAYLEICDYFGESILNPDRTLNRQALRDLVFTDPDKRKKLEAMTHPRILELMRSRAQQATSEYCILSIPLLIETKFQKEVDRILVIDIPEELQIKRVMQRDKISHSQAQSIIDTQIDRKTRLSHADDILDNSQGREQLKQKVDMLNKKYKELSQSYE